MLRGRLIGEVDLDRCSGERRFGVADLRLLLVLLRAAGSFACLLTEQAGAALLFFGATWGLYVVGFGMMASFVFMVSGAWLLLVGVESSAKRRVGEPERLQP